MEKGKSKSYDGLGRVNILHSPQGNLYFSYDMKGGVERVMTDSGKYTERDKSHMYTSFGFWEEVKEIAGEDLCKKIRGESA